MIKLLWRFSLLVLAALFFTWLADRPGTVTIQWMGREIQMAFVVAVAMAFLAIALLWFVWGLFRKVWRSPSTAREYWRFARTARAMNPCRGASLPLAQVTQLRLQKARCHCRQRPGRRTPCQCFGSPGRPAQGRPPCGQAHF